jgi:pimeloyl-ACP methyl ester carboxylesterase
MEVRRGDGSVIAVEVAGEQGAAPVLLCHGLADSRLSARLFTQAARELGLCIMAPDRTGVGGTDPRRLGRLADWVEDAALVLDGLRAESAALLGISAGGPFAAACAARIPGRVRSLTLVCPLGPPGWPTRGMAPGERLSLAVARHAPAFGGWFLCRLAALARRSPRLFLRLAASELPGIDRRAIAQPGMREAFLAGYAEAFRRGSWGVAQDLRVLTRPWVSSSGPSRCRHRSTTGTRTRRSRPGMPGFYAEAIPGEQIQLYPGHGHFSILAAAPEMLAPLAR